MSTIAATILVVDDSREVCALTAGLLRKTGHQVLSAGGAEEALRLLSDLVRIDLLLTDLMLDDANGFGLANDVRALCPQVKVLFMSGHDPDVARALGIDFADAEFIRKPFSPAQVEDAVDRLLTRAGGG